MDLAKADDLIGRLMQGGNTVLYSGKFIDEHAPAFISLTEGLAEAQGRGRPNAHRLSFVLLEAYQNILRHRAQVSGMNSRSMLVMQTRGDTDVVLSLDPVQEEEAQRIQRVISDIAASDLGQLKQRFLSRLRDGARTLRGGAGLGLIEIARKSGGGLVCDRWMLDETHSMLLIQAIMDGRAERALPTAEARALHVLVAEVEAVLAWPGGASRPADAAALRIMQSECSATSLGIAFHAAAEWLAKEAVGMRCTLLLAGRGGSWSLVVAISGERNPLVNLHERVMSATALAPPELEAMHRAALLGREAGIAQSAALLELAKLAQGPAQAFVRSDGQRWRFAWAVPLA
ncbi:MAG: hypothetical protein IPJ85_07505 [Flavobacteriales bacterium]|nr:hypothetical protein [Flavobacteriales bacterium]